MSLKCPACAQNSIPLLTKLLTFGKRPNRFECTACGAELQSHYSPLPLFFVGVLMHFVFMAFTGRPSSIGAFGVTGLWFAAIMLFLIPIRLRAPAGSSASAVTPSAGPAKTSATRRFASPADQALYAFESKVLGFAVWLSTTAYALQVMKSHVRGEVGFGGLIFLFEAALIGVAASVIYVVVMYRVGRRDIRLRLLLDVLAVASVVLVFI
jgi:hypothetical protein